MKTTRKPGTNAYKSALRKSASRMARDLLRVKNKPAGLQALESYLSNKTSGENKGLLNLITKARERRQAMLQKKSWLFEDFSKKSEEKTNQVNKYLREWRKTMNPDWLKLAKIDLNVLLNETVESIADLEFAEKNLPKKRAEKAAKCRHRLEHDCITYLRRLRTIDERREDVD
ncbi:MAG: hypothetical protein WC634_01500 [archaeon]